AGYLLPVVSLHSSFIHPIVTRGGQGRERRVGAAPSYGLAYIAMVLHTSFMEKLQVFGRTAALTIECARRKRDGDNRAVEHGLTVEAASVIPGQQRRYNWENKLGFLVLDHELPLLTCTLLGWLQECA